MELDGDLPHRRITIDLLLVAGETAMDGPQSLYASLIDTLKSTNPEFEVGVDGILHKHRDIDTLQRVGKCLHGKGIGSGTRTYPEDVDAILQTEFHVLRCSHLSRDEHLGLLLHLSEPREGGLTMTLEAAWLGTGLPYACAEVVAAFHGQLTGRSHHLLFALSRTGACYHEGAFVVTRKIQFL